MALRFCSGVRATETEYGTVVLDERNGFYFQLNPTGTIVLRALLDGGGENDAVQALVAEFDVDRDRAARDVSILVEQLHSSGLVTA